MSVSLLWIASYCKFVYKFRLTYSDSLWLTFIFAFTIWFMYLFPCSFRYYQFSNTFAESIFEVYLIWVHFWIQFMIQINFLNSSLVSLFDSVHLGFRFWFGFIFMSKQYSSPSDFLIDAVSELFSGSVMDSYRNSSSKIECFYISAYILILFVIHFLTRIRFMIW